MIQTMIQILIQIIIQVMIQIMSSISTNLYYDFYNQMKWWKNCYSQEYFQSFDQPQCQRTKSLTGSRTDQTKIHSGNISSENFDSGFQSRESGFLSRGGSTSKTSTPNSPNNEVCVEYLFIFL